MQARTSYTKEAPSAETRKGFEQKLGLIAWHHLHEWSSREGSEGVECAQKDVWKLDGRNAAGAESVLLY
jgi:hypothetical protein